jgi:CheY-like chemotaxis protein
VNPVAGGQPGSGPRLALVSPGTQAPPASADRDHDTLTRWRARPACRLLRGATVLVVDGDIGHVFALSQFLGELGMRVTYAETGREGIEQVKREPDTAVILMDMTAPDTDGYWAIEAIRAWPGREDLPIIALTAPGTPGTTENPVSRGASAWVPKPVDLDDLLEVMLAAGPGVGSGPANMTPLRPRILLVDDMDDNLCALEAILRPLDLVLVLANSGPEAMKALLREDFALILMDAVMPGMDGFETAARIKRLDRTRDVPIIFLSAGDRTPDYAFRSPSVGAADYLTKPFEPWVLRAKVEALVGLSQRLDGTRPAPVARWPALAGIQDDLGTCLSRLETTVPRLEGSLAGASRAELARIVTELAGQVRDLRTAADALTGAYQAGDEAQPGRTFS